MIPLRRPSIYPEEKESKRESKTPQILTVIVSLTGLLIIIINSQRFPTKFLHLLVSILVLVVVILVFYILSPPVIRWTQKLLIKRKQSKVILNNFEDFKYFIEKFEEFVKVDGGRNNIATALYTIGVIDDPTEKNVITFTEDLVDKSIFYSLFSVYKVFRDKISYKKSVTENFKFIAEEFDAIIELYNRLIWRSVEKIKKLSKGRNFSDSKESYKEYRDLYISYIKEYIGFSEKMNQKLEEKYFRAYFDFPKEL